MYSDFDTAITIRSAEHKTFLEKELPMNAIRKTSGVDLTARAIEETVVLQHEKKGVNARLTGVDSTFLQMTGMKNHMVDGYPAFYEDGEFRGIIGATLLDKLEGYIPQGFGNESVIVYGPKRDMKMRVGKNPFNTQVVTLSGRMNFNREVNAENLIVPLSAAADILGYSDQELTALYVSVQNDEEKDEVKASLQELVGNQFVVKTNYEKNALIFQTSKTERLIVIVMLVFIFILASFTLVASLTMTFVEKREDVEILRSMGAYRSSLLRIFFFEGLLISGLGVVIGLVIGYAICLAQIKFGLLEMPNSNGEAFPMVVTLSDGLLIVALVSALSIIASYFPVKMLIRRNLKMA